MADDVWEWCEKTNCLGRTVTVKIKWAEFQISSRSRSIEAPIETRAKLRELALELIRSVFPPPKAIRLVGVTLSNFRSLTASFEAELPFVKFNQSRATKIVASTLLVLRTAD
jgi:DNA polymerase IV